MPVIPSPGVDPPVAPIRMGVRSPAGSPSLLGSGVFLSFIIGDPPGLDGGKGTLVDPYPPVAGEIPRVVREVETDDFPRPTLVDPPASIGAVSGVLDPAPPSFPTWRSVPPPPIHKL